MDPINNFQQLFEIGFFPQEDRGKCAKPASLDDFVDLTVALLTEWANPAKGNVCAQYRVIIKVDFITDDFHEVTRDCPDHYLFCLGNVQQSPVKQFLNNEEECRKYKENETQIKRKKKRINPVAKGKHHRRTKIFKKLHFTQLKRWSSKRDQTTLSPHKKKKKSVSIVCHCSERCAVSPIRYVLGRDGEQRGLLKWEEDSVLWLVWATLRD